MATRLSCISSTSHLVPVLTVSPSIEVEEGDSFTLTCTSSIPDLPLIWNDPGSRSEVENVFFTDGSITVVGAIEQNEGDYICMVVEGRGTVVASATTNVNITQREFISFSYYVANFIRT